MKILHVISSLRKSAGTTTFVNGLTEALVADGHEVTIALRAIDGTYVGECPACAARIGTLDEILKSKEHFDVVHIHGLWEWMLIAASRWAKKKGIPVVWSPHGALAPWAMRHHWWKKAAIWYLFQKSALRCAALLHSTATKETEWIRAKGFKQLIVEAPLGTRLPPLVGASSSSLRNNDKFHSAATAPRYTLLFVGRIYPVKGLVNLIKAWHILHESTCYTWLKNWKLRIVGPDQADHQAELEKLVSEFGLLDCVIFPGPKFGDDLSVEYDNCDCLVLPSFTENFGGVVIDALAHGKPVIASTFTPWRELQEQGCGWWVSNEPEKLAGAIKEMMSLNDAARQAMGEQGREWMHRDFDWNAIGSKMKMAYEWLIGRCDKPEWVK